jgi:hypothetical protein
MSRSLPPRSLALLSLCGAIFLGFNGCMFMSDEDRDFYGKGWVNPRELDQTPHHVIPNPEAPQDAAQAPVATTVNHPNPDSDEWTAVPTPQ